MAAWKLHADPTGRLAVAARVALPVLLVLAALAAAALVRPGPARALELCSAQAMAIMRAEGVSEGQIAAICRRARQESAVLALTVRRTEQEVGYCRVTLALQNNSSRYVNAVTLTTEDSLFEVFTFRDLLPGSTDYASARSRSLLACDELGQLKLRFHRPPSVRVEDRALSGPQLQRFQPVLMDERLAWAGRG